MKKIISFILSAAMLLSSLTMLQVQASTQLPEAADGSFDVALFGNTHPSFYVDSNKWMTTLISKLGANRVGNFGNFNMPNAIPNVGNLCNSNAELVLIDTAIVRDGGVGSGYIDVKYLEGILMSLANKEKRPYVALIDPVNASLENDAPAYISDLANAYGVQEIKLSESGITAAGFTGGKANDSAYELFASYVQEKLTYTQITMPDASAKVSNASAAIAVQNIFSGDITNETKVIEFSGSQLFIKLTNNDSSTTEALQVYIDGKSYGTLTNLGGMAYTTCDLTDTPHVLVLTATETVKVDGIYARDAAISGDSVGIGFEDNYINAVGKTNVTAELVNDAADSSAHALKVTTTATNGEITVPVNLKVGKKYTVTAKIKPTAVPDGNSSDLLVNLYQLPKDSNGNPISGTAWTTNSISGFTLNEWKTVSTTFTVADTANIGGGNTTAVTGYGNIAFRFGNGNVGNVGNEMIIDDITITPVYEESSEYFDSFNISFDDESYAPATSIVVGNGNYSYIDDDKGGKALKAQDLWGGHEFIRVENFLMRPNSVYKIHYRVKGMTDATVGKYMRLIVDRNGKHKDKSGADAKSQPFGGNYLWPDNALRLTTDWQDVTYYYKTSDGKVTDEMGWANLYFRFSADGLVNSKLESNIIIRVAIDDYSIEPVSVPAGAMFSEGQLPGKNSATIAVDDSDNNVLNVTQSVAENGTNDLVFGIPFEKGKKYTVSFDVKGTQGMTVRTIAFAPFNGNNYWPTANELAISDEWQTYTATVDYAPVEYVYPQLLLRAKNPGTYSIKNVNFREVKTDGIASITAPAEIIRNTYTAFTFTDNSASSAGYVYRIYAKNAAGNKVIYSDGTTTSQKAGFTAAAPVGTVLYAEVAPVSATGETGNFVEKELGTVTTTIQLSISARIHLNAEDKLQADVTVMNDARQREAVIYIAQYDANDKLLAVIMETKQIPAYDDNIYTVTAELDDGEVASAKVMVWNDSLTPYCEYAELL